MIGRLSMPEVADTKLAYRLRINAAGKFREGSITLVHKEVVVEKADDAIATLTAARSENRPIEVYFDAHNQNGIDAIRAHFAKRLAVPPETAPQPLESDSSM